MKYTNNKSVQFSSMMSVVLQFSGMEGTPKKLGILYIIELDKKITIKKASSLNPSKNKQCVML